MLIYISSKNKFYEIKKDLEKMGFTAPNGLNIEYENAKGFYHGNSNLYFHAFYNNLTLKNEYEITNKSAYLSYPQFNNGTFNKEIEQGKNILYSFRCKWGV